MNDIFTRPAPYVVPVHQLCTLSHNQRIEMYIAQTRDAARPTPHSHAARGNENKFTT